jgi:hypothetical protein
LPWLPSSELVAPSGNNNNEITLTSAQQEEIDRRLASCSDVKQQGKSWQEIKQKFT